MKYLKYMLLFFVLLVVNCTLLQSARQVVAVRNLQVSLLKVEIGRVDFSGINTNFYFNVKNPNAVDAKILSFDFDALFNNEKVARGMLDRMVDIKSGDSKEIVIPVHIPYSGLSSGIKNAILQKSAEAAVKGYISINTPVGRLKFKVLDKTRKVL